MRCATGQHARRRLGLGVFMPVCRLSPRPCSSPVVSLTQPSAPSSPDLRDLRWVRATVIAPARKQSRCNYAIPRDYVERDAATEIVAADPAAAVAIGTTFEAHYTDRKGRPPGLSC